MNIAGSTNVLEVDLSKSNELGMEMSKKRSFPDWDNEMHLDLGEKGDFGMEASKQNIFLDSGEKGDFGMEASKQNIFLDSGEKGDFGMEVSKQRIFSDEGKDHIWNFVYIANSVHSVIIDVSPSDREISESNVQAGKNMRVK